MQYNTSMQDTDAAIRGVVRLLLFVSILFLLLLILDVSAGQSSADRNTQTENHFFLGREQKPTNRSPS